MAKGGRDHFELFESHTILKHLILDKYLKRWAAKLLSRWDEIWFVDAFAGEGCDRHGNPGSPLILQLRWLLARYGRRGLLAEPELRCRFSQSSWTPCGTPSCKPSCSPTSTESRGSFT